MKSILLIFLSLTMSQAIFAEQKFGSGADFKKIISISEVLAHPKKYVDKELTVSGQIVDVCEKRGCWIKLASDKKFQTLRIKVTDGEIIFPLSSRGKKAAAKGVLKEIPLTKEEATSYFEHLAKEQRKEFDPKSITGAMTVYQLQATGVTIR